MKTCAHCLREFTPSIDGTGEPVFADIAGTDCCDTCYCALCGHGHPTTDEHESCQNEHGQHLGDPVDPDVLEAIHRDRLAEV